MPRRLAPARSRRLRRARARNSTRRRETRESRVPIMTWTAVASSRIKSRSLALRLLSVRRHATKRGRRSSGRIDRPRHHRIPRPHPWPAPCTRQLRLAQSRGLARPRRSRRSLKINSIAVAKLSCDRTSSRQPRARRARLSCSASCRWKSSALHRHRSCSGRTSTSRGRVDPLRARPAAGGLRFIAGSTAPVGMTPSSRPHACNHSHQRALEPASTPKSRPRSRRT